MNIPHEVAKVVGPLFALLLSGCIADAASPPVEGDDSTSEATGETSESLTVDESVILPDMAILRYCALYPKRCEHIKEELLPRPPECLSCPPETFRRRLEVMDPHRLRDLGRSGSAGR